MFYEWSTHFMVKDILNQQISKLPLIHLICRVILTKFSFVKSAKRKDRRLFALLLLKGEYSYYQVVQDLQETTTVNKSQEYIEEKGHNSRNAPDFEYNLIIWSSRT